MSHVSTINVEIRDLEALKEACKVLGLEFKEGQKTYKWFGRHVGDYCFHPDTQILTENGLKPCYCVTEKDKVMTLNPKTNNITFQHPTQVNTNHFSGNLFHIFGKGFDQLITPNHRIFARRREDRANRTPTKYKFLEVQDLPKKNFSKYTIPRSGIWNGKTPASISLAATPEKIKAYKLFVSKAKLRGSPPKNSQDWCFYKTQDFISLIGWFLAEGGTFSGHNYRTTIYQSQKANKKKCIIIKKLLHNLGIHNNYSRDGFVITSEQLWQFFSGLGNTYSKSIPSWVKDLDQAHLQKLIDAMLLGNGTAGRRYYTTCKELRDGFIEVAIKAGYAVTYSLKPNKYPIWEINLSKRNIHHQISNLERIPYTGSVFCLSVPNGILMTSHNGKLSWSGNSVPPGFTVKDLGKCDHALSVKGNSGAYEVGLVKKGDQYVPLWDFWSGGYGLEACVGKNGDKLVEAYTKAASVRVAKDFARKKGFTYVEKFNEETGETIIKLRKY